MSQINVYVRKTNCHASAGGVAGRVDYISSPKRQKEKLIMTVGVREPEYWKRLAADCQYSFNKAEGRECIEARELTVALPNIIGELAEDEQKEKLLSLKEFIDFRTGTDCLIALHDSHATSNDPQSNYHVHIIIPERSLLDTPETIVAERNLFFDKNGKRRYKKSEIYENGELREGCSIVKKGTVLHEKYFGDKNSELGSQAWLFEIKGDLASWINKELQPDRERVVYNRNTSLTIPTNHVGKGRPDAQRRNIEEDNDVIRRYNKLVLDGKITEEEAERNKILIMLSPDRAGECDNFINAYYQTLNPNYKYTDKTAEAKRTRVLDPEKEKLRELYRESAVAWKNYRDEENPEWKKEVLRYAKALSAEIDRQKKLLGFWTKKDYEKSIKKKENEVRYLENRVCRTKRKSKKANYKLEYVATVKNIEERDKEIQHKISKIQKDIEAMENCYMNKYLALSEEERFKYRLDIMRKQSDIRQLEEESKQLNSFFLLSEEEAERMFWERDRIEAKKAKREYKEAKAKLREEKRELREKLRQEAIQEKQQERAARQQSRAEKISQRKSSLDDIVSNARKRAGGINKEKPSPDKNKGRE